MRKRHPPTYASYLTLTFRLSYSVFFAAFDMSRRVGLRVKALSGGDTQSDWNNILVLDLLTRDEWKPQQRLQAQGSRKLRLSSLVV